MNVAPSAADEAELDLPRGQCDAILAEWNRLFDQLEEMDQNTPWFGALFAEWENLNEKYERSDDLYYQRMARLTP